PVLAMEMAIRRHEMHQRPQAAIAHAVVVIRNIAFAEREQHHRESRLAARRHRDASGTGLASRPRHPNTPVALQKPQECRADTTDRRLDAVGAVLANNADRRAIGDYDQSGGATVSIPDTRTLLSPRPVF